ncbi:hypothetical protein [Clostridium neonatale]|uniref:hypothetical protein n=1 Tax=Clostridium neonatale TaxID=137838 RepID=UPI00291C27EC|nr:conserved hypothetical protein [Clostridium neonatale]
MEKDSIEKELREKWFKNHKASLEKLSEDVSILRWREPGTSAYSVRYIFDYNKIYVTGDLGDAIFKIYDKVDLEKVASFDIYYFHKKLTAIDEEKWSFNSEKATLRLKEEIAQIEENKSEYLGLDEDGTGIINELSDKESAKVAEYDEYIEMFNSMIEETEECLFRSHWVQIIYSNHLDQLSDYDSDFYEWIFDIGNEYPREVQAFLIGLQMAAKQLKEIEVEQ